MRKLKHLSLLLVAITLLVGCSGDGPAGPQGKIGAQGVPGSGLQGVASFSMILSLNNLQNASNTPQYFYHLYQAYDSNYTYTVDVYVNRPGTTDWFKLPYYGFYVTNPSYDELYASIGRDSVKIWYLSPATWPDSSLNAKVIVTPQQAK